MRIEFRCCKIRDKCDKCGKTVNVGETIGLDRTSPLFKIYCFRCGKEIIVEVKGD